MNRFPLALKHLPCKIYERFLKTTTHGKQLEPQLHWFWPIKVDSFWNRFFRLDFKCLGREKLFASRWQGRISCVSEGNWLLILDFPGIDAPQIQDSSCVCVWLPLDLASRSTFPLYQSVSQRSRHQPLQLKTPEAFIFSLWASGFP